MLSSTPLKATLFAAAVAAKGIKLETRIGIATTCIPYGNELTLGPAPTVKPPKSPGQAISVNIIAPSCNSCGCQGDGCTAINIYQTVYNEFDGAGALTSRTYVVTESYPGVAPTAAPTVDTTDCPLGFTTTVSTCTACATKATATLTVPASTCPYVTGLSSPSPVPSGVSVSPFELCTTALPPVSSSEAQAAKPAPGNENPGAAAEDKPSDAGSDSGAGAAPAPYPQDTAAPSPEADTGSDKGAAPAPAPGPAPSSNPAPGSPSAAPTYVKSSGSRPLAPIMAGVMGLFISVLAAI
ncbi:unnamed protein product [Discula destructiva]